MLPRPVDSESCSGIFITQLPETIKDLLSTFYPERKNFGDLLTHCRRELVQAVWAILLDDDFVNAYKNGIVITCFDGVKRRVFPRIFTYSADYPEMYVCRACNWPIDLIKQLDRVILATIRDKGQCPCPRCFIPASRFDHLGWLADAIARVKNARRYLASKIIAARNSIYKRGASIKGVAVEALLKELSLVPTVVRSVH